MDHPATKMQRYFLLSRVTRRIKISFISIVTFCPNVAIPPNMFCMLNRRNEFYDVTGNGTSFHHGISLVCYCQPGFRVTGTFYFLTCTKLGTKDKFLQAIVRFIVATNNGHQNFQNAKVGAKSHLLSQDFLTVWNRAFQRYYVRIHHFPFEVVGTSPSSSSVTGKLDHITFLVLKK